MFSFMLNFHDSKNQIVCGTTNGRVVKIIKDGDIKQTQNAIKSRVITHATTVSFTIDAGFKSIVFWLIFHFFLSASKLKNSTNIVYRIQQAPLCS